MRKLCLCLVLLASLSHAATAQEAVAGRATRAAEGALSAHAARAAVRV